MSLNFVILVAIVCVVIEGFFSGSEIAVVSASKAKLRMKAKAGNKGAKLAEHYLETPEKLLATTLLGTNLATVTFSVTVALFLVFGNYDNAEFLAVLAVTPMTLVFGEIIPKTTFQQHADQWVTKLVYPLRLATWLFSPLVFVMSGFAKLMLSFFGNEQKRAFVTREELGILIDMDGGEDISPDEREMISNVLDMSKAEVGHLMVPLSEVTALPVETTLREASRELADKGYSRLPVYEERIDNMVGVLHVFDFLRAGVLHRDKPIGDVAKAPVFVPESKLAVTLLRELQKNGQTMAIVVDEYGGAVGIVTIEDLLEEIVGDIEDEHDKEQAAPLVPERPGVWRVEARESVERINEECGLSLPLSEDYETLAGFLLEVFKRIPGQGETVHMGGATLRITKASQRAIEEVQVLKTRRRRSLQKKQTIDKP